jgi:protein-tyrosine phosphatase
MPDARAVRSSSEPFSVLMVCTGNICRSPLAEQLLTARFGEAGLHLVTHVESAGLAALAGASMDATAEEMSRKLRGAVGPFQARQLRTSIATRADLILTMTKDQRDEVVRNYPRLLQRTFTLTEFAKLLAADTEAIIEESASAGAPRIVTVVGGLHSNPAHQFREQTARLARSRSRARLVPGDDVADPFRQSVAAHEAVAQQISLSTSQIAHNFVAWTANTSGNVGLNR